MKQAKNQDKEIKKDNRIINASCGLFGIYDDYIQSFQSLDQRFVKNKNSTYFFQAKNHSMSPLILEKDILIVDRSVSVEHNHIAIVEFEGEFLCKRIFKGPNSLILHSDNSIFKDIVISMEQELKIFGRVISLVRDFTCLL